MTKLNLLILIFFSCLLASCSDNNDTNTWIVGTSADNPPYEFIKEGQVVGFDIDLITEIGKHLGKKVKFKNMEFHSLIASLSSKNIDMVIAGLSMTPDRAARVDFSIPYTSANIAVLYREESNIKTEEDLKNKNVGAQLGTIWSLIAHDLSLKNPFTVKSLANNLMLVEELKSKRLDAIILENSQAKRFTEIYPTLGRLSLNNIGSYFSIALPKTSTLKDDIDHAIDALKNNGTTKRLEEKWGITGEDAGI